MGSSPAPDFFFLLQFFVNDVDKTGIGYSKIARSSKPLSISLLLQILQEYPRAVLVHVS